MLDQGPGTASGSAFVRLEHLLRDVAAPAHASPTLLHLGETHFRPPGALLAALADPAGWGRYPQPGGSPALRDAYTGWLARRFGGVGATAGVDVEPTPGTKQAVSVCIAHAVDAGRARGALQPVVLLPDLFYPAYLSALEWSGAVPLFYDCRHADLDQELATRAEQAGAALCAVVVCNPGNPTGDLLDAGVMRKIHRRCRALDVPLLVDECYIDLYHDAPAPGFLQSCCEDTCTGALVFHTLSKRSGAPGLRSGFVAGDARLVTRYRLYNRQCGVSLAQPVCASSTALWSDEAHVDAHRGQIAGNWAVADRACRGWPEYRRPGAGFFLCLAVDDDLAATRTLWRDHAIRVMPGSFLAAPGSVAGAAARFLRIALVEDSAALQNTLARIVTCLA